VLALLNLRASPRGSDHGDRRLLQITVFLISSIRQ